MTWPTAPSGPGAGAILRRRARHVGDTHAPGACLPRLLAAQERPVFLIADADFRDHSRLEEGHVVDTSQPRT
jgi:hypothetical protein